MKGKGKRNYFMVALRGVAMGAADVIPGVSGGTIAFITGIYSELIGSIRAFDMEMVRMLCRFEFKRVWTKINGAFLGSVLGGIALSIFSLAQVMKYLLETHPIFIWSFFFGLIIASAFLVAKEVERWSLGVIVAGVIGVVISYLITIVSPASTPDTWWFVMLSGAVAICAMILPGISGAFILLLLGKYAYIIDAVSRFDVAILATFAFGAIVGIISFSRLLSWLLSKYYSMTVALLIGFMLGSLNKIWPWKEVLTTFTDGNGAVQPLTEANVWPSTFESLTGQSAQVWEAAAAAAAGLLLIWVITAVASAMAKRGKA